MKNHKPLMDGVTLVKSTENVESSWKTKAPFSYNQLNCNACPFLKPEDRFMSKGYTYRTCEIICFIHYP